MSNSGGVKPLHSDRHRLGIISVATTDFVSTGEFDFIGLVTPIPQDGSISVIFIPAPANVQSVESSHSCEAGCCLDRQAVCPQP